MSQRFRREWETARLVFRPPHDSDVEALMEMSRDSDTLRHLAHLCESFEEDDTQRLLEDAAVVAWPQGRAVWVARERETERIVGRVDIARVSQRHGNAELGFLVAPDARGEGFAAEIVAGTTEALLADGFARVQLQVRDDNLAAQRAAIRAGFAVDARVPQAYPDRSGQRFDALLYTKTLGDPPGSQLRVLPDLPSEGLRDETAIIRPLCAADAKVYFRQSARPAEWQRAVPPIPPVWENVRRLCEYRAASDWLAGNNARMTIRDSEDRYAGTIGLHRLVGPPGESMLSYGLLPEFQGQGMATRAVRLVATWAFAHTDTVRLMAGTAVDNDASQAVLQRAGFTREGVQRALLPGQEDSRVDNVCWSLLHSEV